MHAPEHLDIQSIRRGNKHRKGKTTYSTTFAISLNVATGNFLTDSMRAASYGRTARHICVSRHVRGCGGKDDEGEQGCEEGKELHDSMG